MERLVTNRKAHARPLLCLAVGASWWILSGRTHAESRTSHLQAASSSRGQAGPGALWEQMERGPHTGSFQEALVGVEVTASTSDGAVKRVHHGNGVILRCDGYVLVPTSLFGTSLDVAGSKEEASSLRISIVLRPGMAGERRVSAHRPRFERPGLGFTVAKIDNWHGPALLTETPVEMAANETVDLYWVAWDGTANKWLPLKHQSAKLGAFPSEGGKEKPGRREFAEPQPAVSLGRWSWDPPGGRSASSRRAVRRRGQKPSSGVTPYRLRRTVWYRRRRRRREALVNNLTARKTTRRGRQTRGCLAR
jgi:hypothetical protein